MTSSTISSSLERRHKNRQIKNVLGCVVTLIVPIAFCALLVWIPQLYNSWQLNRFAGNLFNYPLPPQSEVISRHAEVGLMGNGNHCDFVAIQTMRSRLTVNEIEAYYDEVSIPPVNMKNVSLEPEFRGGPRPIFVDFDSSVLEDRWQRLTIRVWDYGYGAGLDLRCH